MDRRRMALECQEVERCGGSVLDFLREQGAVSPRGTWWRLQAEELRRPRSQIRDGKENSMYRKPVLTPEARAEAERMIAAGEDPKPYLKEHGSKNPSAHEYMIRKGMEKRRAEEHDCGQPEIKEFDGKEYEKMEEPAPGSVTVMDRLPEEAKTAEDGKKICAPLTYEGLKVREVEGLYGRYRLKMEIGAQYIDYESLEGEEVSMRPWEWSEFMKEMKKAAAILGVDVE